MRSLLLVSDSRADWDVLRPIARRAAAAGEIRIRVLATGAQLDPARTEGLKRIEAEFDVAARVPSLVPADGAADDEVAPARAAGRIVAGVGENLPRIKPDAVVVMGDRYEQGAAAYAAHLLRFPIIHLHGGEASYGAFDDATRHAITKLATYHFVSTEEYGRRVIRMGEDPARVFVVGAPALANLDEVPRLDRAALAGALGTDLPDGRPLILLTVHAETLAGPEASVRLAEAVLEALEPLEATVVATSPNVDPGGAAIRRRLESFCARAPERRRLYDLLGTERFWNLMRHADVMVGNSSSGIIEAPSVGLPVVNVGGRQDGRVRGKNVIDGAPDATAVAESVARALDPAFRKAARAAKNPYGDGSAAEKIVEKLRTLPLGPGVVRKVFYEA